MRGPITYYRAAADAVWARSLVIDIGLGLYAASQSSASIGVDASETQDGVASGDYSRLPLAGRLTAAAHVDDSRALRSLLSSSPGFVEVLASGLDQLSGLDAISGPPRICLETDPEEGGEYIAVEVRTVLPPADAYRLWQQQLELWIADAWFISPVPLRVSLVPA